MELRCQEVGWKGGVISVGREPRKKNFFSLSSAEREYKTSNFLCYPVSHSH